MKRETAIPAAITFGLMVILIAGLGLCARFSWQRGDIYLITSELAPYGMDSWRYPPTQEQLAERERCFKMWSESAVRQRADWRRASWTVCALGIIPVISIVLISATVYKELKRPSNKPGGR